MKLDCTELGDGWQIIDYDNSCKQLVIADDVEGAWYLAAMRLEKIINIATKALKTEA